MHYGKNKSNFLLCFIIANYRLLFCKASSQKYLVGLVLVTMKMVKDAKGFCQIPTGIKRNIKRQVFFFFRVPAVVQPGINPNPSGP